MPVRFSKPIPLKTASGSFMVMILGCLISTSSLSQDLIKRQYGIQTVIANQVYGTAVNYLGSLDTLKLDIYKPSGNASKSRPLLILNHGGAWIAGDKSETSLAIIATEFARRGYVVASVNYRLGLHKADWAPTPFQKDVNAAFHALYIADSAEVYRAAFRAMQDIKGAIRFMKARHLQDSTCTDAAFIGGESAGGFNSLQVALLDQTSEKPASCFAIGDVPMPQNNLLDNYPGGKVSATQLRRPDLGNIDGSLNLNGQDARVKGVINLFGGLFSEALSGHWMHGQDTPSIYMSHQTCDGIVPCNTSVCLSPLSVNCNLGYTPFHLKWPVIHGSCALQSQFKSKLRSVKTEIFPCEDIVFPLTDCVRYAQNGSYHYTVNVLLRCDSISRFLAPVAVNSTRNCLTAGIHAPQKPQKPGLFPNPSKGEFRIQGSWEAIQIKDVLGNDIPFATNPQGNVKLSGVPSSSLLLIYVKSGDGWTVQKLFIDGSLNP